MDDHRLSSGSSRFAVSKSHRPSQQSPEKPGGFVPLTLMLIPSSMTVELTKSDMLMGRHSSADIRLPLADVSRRHCRFFFTDASWRVQDLDSLNGVFVNNQRVREATLKDGDRIRVGSFVFQAMLPPTTAVPESRKDTRRDD
jgi:pSer/pThr/pTyr-binding forkhead associated (FHA) protein